MRKKLHISSHPFCLTIISQNWYVCPESIQQHLPFSAASAVDPLRSDQENSHLESGHCRMKAEASKNLSSRYILEVIAGPRVHSNTIAFVTSVLDFPYSLSLLALLHMDGRRQTAIDRSSSPTVHSSLPRFLTSMQDASKLSFIFGKWNSYARSLHFASAIRRPRASR